MMCKVKQRKEVTENDQNNERNNTEGHPDKNYRGQHPQRLRQQKLLPIPSRYQRLQSDRNHSMVCKRENRRI